MAKLGRCSHELCRIPGVGEKLAAMLVELGYERIDALHDADPERMYRQLCSLRGEAVDRCVLYTFRCAVYYASHHDHEPQKLKWWYWKDPS